MKWMVLLILGGLGLAALIGGLIWSAKRYDISTSGLHAQGRVVENYKSVSVADPDSGKRSSVSYYPVVEFQTAQGEKIRFQGSTGTRTPDFEVGTPVAVVYKPQTPYEAQLTEFSQMWLGPVVITVAGLIFLLMSVGSFFLIGGSDASEKNFDRQFLSMRPDTVKISGTIREVRVKKRGEYVFVCMALRPGATMEEEFETDFFTFDPGKEFIGRTLTIILDPFDPKSYYVDLDTMLKEILVRQKRN